MMKSETGNTQENAEMGELREQVRRLEKRQDRIFLTYLLFVFVMASIFSIIYIQHGFNQDTMDNFKNHYDAIFEVVGVLDDHKAHIEKLYGMGEGDGVEDVLIIGGDVEQLCQNMCEGMVEEEGLTLENVTITYEEEGVGCECLASDPAGENTAMTLTGGL